VKRNESRDIGSAIMIFVLHVFMAMVIGSLIMVAIAIIVAPFLQDAPRLESVVDWGGFLNPIVWLPGILLGFLVNRFLNRLIPGHFACWVWIIGGIWLTAAIGNSVRYYDARYAEGCSIAQRVVNDFLVLNSHRCGGGGESTLAGLFFTMPAVSSIGYAVGAWLAFRFRKARSLNTVA
jgi:hypothetical protein